jgi:hypothetical protein
MSEGARGTICHAGAAKERPQRWPLARKWHFSNQGLKPMNLYAKLGCAAVGALALGYVTNTHAATVVFCGPQPEPNCESGTELKVFLDKAKDVMSDTGDVGTQQGTPPVMLITSDGGALNVFFDASNGFGTITPTQGQVDFNGLNFSIPGFTFKDLVFDVQLTPTSSATDNFTVTADGSFGTVIGNEADAANTDKEFSVTATSGFLTSVNVDSLTGFDEIKHIEVSGLAPLAIPEPKTWALLGIGFAFLAFLGFKRNIVISHPL